MRSAWSIGASAISAHTSTTFTTDQLSKHRSDDFEFLHTADIYSIARVNQDTGNGGGSAQSWEGYAVGGLPALALANGLLSFELVLYTHARIHA